MGAFDIWVHLRWSMQGAAPPAPPAWISHHQQAFAAMAFQHSGKKTETLSSMNFCTKKPAVVKNTDAWKVQNLSGAVENFYVNPLCIPYSFLPVENPCGKTCWECGKLLWTKLWEKWITLHYVNWLLWLIGVHLCRAGSWPRRSTNSIEW